jgi:hypothetical protein
MREQAIDLWSFLGIADAICVTTNGATDKRGYGVMGRGCALEAKQRYPQIDGRLGRHLINSGNVPGIINDRPVIVSFPVKPAFGEYREDDVVISQIGKWRKGAIVPGWAMKAQTKIILQSAHLLAEMAAKSKWKEVVLPRPGCGNGELKWETVKPILEGVLDDRFIVVTRKTKY